MKNFAATLLTAVTIALSTTPVFAADAVCGGENIMAQLKAEKPEVAAAVEKEAAALPNGDSVLWQVTKPGVAPSYLFGTMHMADPRLLKLPDNVQKAFDESNVLALEITEILDPAVMAGKAVGLMKYSMYLDGTTLDTKMNKDQIAAVKQRLEKHVGLPWGVAKKLRPWAIVGSLAFPACELARKKAGKPFLDMALGLAAKKDGKTIVALETMESQMQAMASLPEQDMINAMVETAKIGDRMEDVFETMIVLYRENRISTIWAMMRHLSPDGVKTETDSAGYEQFQRVIVDARNFKMADGSAKLIDKGGAFIAVGALHLPGEKGLVNILAQRGYTVKPF